MAELGPPPATPRSTHLREHHGAVFDDPYEWLRDPEDPAVLAHLEAENTYAEAVTEHLGPLRTRLVGEIKARTQETDLSVPVASGPWWYYARTVEGLPYEIHARVPRHPGAPRPVLDAGAVPDGEQVLLDGNAAAQGSDFFALGAFTVSRDHRVLAYAVDRTGDERFDLTVVDLATSEVLDTAVTGIGYGVELSGDAAYVFVTRVDEAWRPHEIWRHRVGGPTGEDVLVLREDDERFWMGLGLSRDERWVVVGLGSRTTSEVHLLDADDPTGPLRCVAPRREGVEYDVEPAGDHLLIVHNEDNPDFDLARAPLDATRAEQWRPLLRAEPGERFGAVDAFAGYAVLSLRTGGLTALRVMARDDGSATGYGPARDLAFAGEVHTVALADVPEWESTVVQVTHESMTVPRSVLDVDLATGAQTLVKRQPVLAGYDPDDYVERRLWARAADGRDIPVTVVHHRDVRPDGTNPGILYGYGCYETSLDPWFSLHRVSLYDRGVVLALAHVRGGGEMGRSWWEEGRLAAKPTTFTDTLACLDAVVGAGWFDPARVCLEGGSGGGLLVGAVVNLAPERFRLAYAQVPFVDALTSMLRPDLPLTVGEWDEWGNPLADPDIYRVMRSYTPYENVRAVDYPAVLATTSLHDTRVSFAEPAKWVARLRETVTSDPTRRPVLLRTEMAAGHGGPSDRYAAWADIAWDRAFVLDQLGAVDLLPGAGIVPSMEKEEPR